MRACFVDFVDLGVASFTATVEDVVELFAIPPVEDTSEGL